MQQINDELTMKVIDGKWKLKKTVVTIDVDSTVLGSISGKDELEFELLNYETGDGMLKIHLKNLPELLAKA